MVCFDGRRHLYCTCTTSREGDELHIPILATFADVFPAPVQRLFLPHPSSCFGSSPVTIRPDSVDSLGLLPKFDSKTARAAAR